MENSDPALVEHARGRARTDLLAFMQWCWWNPQPLRVGRHTRAICRRLTQAVEDWREGRSTYLLIAVPFRHGKSDIVSRALPAFFLGRCAQSQPDVIMSGYGADLIEGFSRKVKTILASQAYQALFPGVLPQRGANRAGAWAIEGSSGSVSATGLGGSITGKGGHLIIVDDYCKNISQARSPAFRDKTWQAFTADLMTRQNAPAALVIVCATPWDPDDIHGRIRRHLAADPAFPPFETLAFPAHQPGPNGYPTLFPELFDPAWYTRQRATLGHQAAALLDCSPLPPQGGRFPPDRLLLHPTLDSWPQTREHRAWDLASSSRQRNSPDPDWTWGIRGALTHEPGAPPRPHLWIRHATCLRAEAPARNDHIRSTALADGSRVGQIIEAYGAYKDAYTQLRDALRGLAPVHPSRLPGDKSAKLAPLEAPWEAGHIHLYTGPGGIEGATLTRFLEDFTAFPHGRHDDACDATALLYHTLLHQSAPKILL